MRASNFMCLVLLLALTIASTNIVRQCEAATAARPEPEESKRQPTGSKWTVTVFNYQDGGPLHVHCKSKDDDRGEQVLQNNGDRFDFSFKENFWQTTLYWCNFSSQKGFASFEVFWPEKTLWLEKRCGFTNCFWFARNDGFYLEDRSQGTSLLLHNWEPNA